MTILTSLAAKVSPTGILAPSYADILETLQAQFLAIYGSDAYISADSQDGQLLAIVASAINDCNSQAVAVYNNQSPTFAQGAGLSSVVKINNIQRLVATESTATGNIVGIVGTVIGNGIVSDINGNLWDLPATVTIPAAGTIGVTVTAQEVGAISAPAGTINVINTPVLGWQSFVSVTDAVAGNPVETDAALRRRQAVSTGITAETPLGAMLANLANLTGVSRVAVYENPTGTTDANGLPAHSISVVISGGDLTEIAGIIGQKKTPGAGTYGTTTQLYPDPVTGILYTINFFLLINNSIAVSVVGSKLSGYSSIVGTEIQNAVATFLNSLSIGQAVQYTRVFPAAYLNGAADSLTYEITALTIGLKPAVWGGSYTVDKSPSITVAGHTLTKSSAGGAFGSARATVGRGSSVAGFYCELKPTIDAAGQVVIGIGNIAAGIGNYVGADASGYGYQGATGNKVTGAVSAAYGATFTVNDIIGVLLKFTGAGLGSLTFYKNGVSQGVAYAAIPLTLYYPMVSLFTLADAVLFNLGDTAVAALPITLATADIAIPFNQAAACLAASDVTVAIT